MPNSSLSALLHGTTARGCLLNATYTGEHRRLRGALCLGSEPDLQFVYNRRIETLFNSSARWRGYDVFGRQKLSTLMASKAAVDELSDRYMSLHASHGFKGLDAETQYLIFVEMTEIALWGNATDLSLLTSLSLEQIHSLQGKEAIREGQARIVSNDMPAAWAWLSANREQCIDIVLDNSGFEFFTDLVYALYLVDSGLASEINFHVKSMPWFVSDVTPQDVDVLLTTLSDSKAFCPDTGHKTGELTKRLKYAFEKKLFRIKEHPFWTTGFDFHVMPREAPDLVDSLLQSTLVVFKGDLNYRKLVRDACWPHTTQFKTALGDLGRPIGTGPEAKPLRIMALRTNKADVCVGVDEVSLRRVENEAPGKAWVRNGKYAVVSFSDGA